MQCYLLARYTVIGLLVIGQNDSGQNGTDKNGIRIKWYTDKMVLNKMYGQNGTDKMVQFYILCTF